MYLPNYILIKKIQPNNKNIELTLKILNIQIKDDVFMKYWAIITMSQFLQILGIKRMFVCRNPHSFVAIFTLKIWAHDKISILRNILLACVTLFIDITSKWSLK